MKNLILITGGAGYIGAVLSRLLLKAGYRVRVLDNLLFGGEALVELVPDSNFEFVKIDIRDPQVATHLEGVDAVVHLAAIVGDPAVSKYENEAISVMEAGTRQFYLACEEAGVPHFIFASTCSAYGIMDDQQTPLDETAPLNPQSLYARLKVDFERWLMQRAAPSTAYSLLRFSTVYGISPRMRFDLSVNHFTRDLTLDTELVVFGKDTWRPYCHVQDLSRSVIEVIKRGPEAMNGKIYNVGGNNENYTKEDLVEEIRKVVPGASIHYKELGTTDPRNYRVDFTRIMEELDFSLTRTVPEGIEEVHKLVASGLLPDPFSDAYNNL